MESDRLDSLYAKIKEQKEANDKKNLAAFLDKLTVGLTQDLDKLYLSGDVDRYERVLQNTKGFGFRVFRNKQGKHLLKID